MKYSNLKSSAFGIIFAATGAISTLVADPLLPSGAVMAPFIGSLTSGSVVASDLSSFAASTVSGQVGVTVLSGVGTNPLGGLTFVYEVMNLSTSGTEGITSFGLDGWAGVDMDIVTGDSFFFSSGGTGVEEGFTYRTPDGNSILFDFPPGSSEPPIFAGEKSWQLIVYTNATAFTVGNVWVDGWDFLDPSGGYTDGTFWSDSMTSFVAVGSVPDGGSTVLLFGIGFILMALSLARAKLTVARK